MYQSEYDQQFKLFSSLIGKSSLRIHNNDLSYIYRLIISKMCHVSTTLFSVEIQGPKIQNHFMFCLWNVLQFAYFVDIMKNVWIF